MPENNRNTTITVGTDVVVLSEETPENQEVIFRFIQNTSAGGQTIKLSFQDEANTNTGMTLSPGGYYEESKDNGYFVNRARITAIASAAGGSVGITERKILRG